MSDQISPRSTTAITVFNASNPLMHQVSGWAIRYPECEIVSHFRRSLSSVRNALQRTEIVIADATEDPIAAMAVLAEAVTVMEPTCVVAYSEKLHEGLELFVRSRGILLLFGPTSDIHWGAQIETMLHSASRMESSSQVMQSYVAYSGKFAKASLQGQCFLKAFPRRSSRFLA